MARVGAFTGLYENLMYGDAEFQLAISSQFNLEGDASKLKKKFTVSIYSIYLHERPPLEKALIKNIWI